MQFEQEIIDLGFKPDIIGKNQRIQSYKLEFDDIVFLYIKSGVTIFYEYYGRNRLRHIYHHDSIREKFIDMIREFKQQELDNKICAILI